MKYLDEAGLGYLLSKLKETYARKGEAGGSTWHTGTELSGKGDVTLPEKCELSVVRTVHGMERKTAEVLLTAQRDLENVTVSGEYYGVQGYDTYTFSVNGRDIFYSGNGDHEFAQLWSGSLSSGQTIKLRNYRGTNDRVSAREAETRFVVHYEGEPSDFEVSTGSTDDTAWTVTPSIAISAFSAGDYYLNTGELTLYRCTDASETSSSWTYLCTLGGGEAGGTGGDVDLSAYATKDELANYIPTSRESTFAKKTDLSGYIPTSERSAFATKDELSDYTTKDDLANYIPTSRESTFAKKTDLSGYIPTSERSAFATKDELSGYATKDELSDYVTRNELSQAGTGNAINAAIVTLDSDSFESDGQPHAPKVASVMLGGQPLTENVDYAPVAVPASAAGTYSALAIGIGQYTGAASAAWRICKTSPNLRLSASSLTLKGVMGASDSSITVSRDGSGQLSAESLQPQCATASIVGSALRVTSVKPGSATILVRVDEDEDYDSAEVRLTVDIQRADGSISVEPQSLSIDGPAGTTASATITKTGSGAVSVSESDCLTSQISGNRITLTSVRSGSARLTLSLAETNDYTAASCTLDAQVTVATVAPSTTLADNSWATIASVAASGDAQKYWKVGDIISLTTTYKAASHKTVQFRICGFDHDDLDSGDENYNNPNYNNGTNKAAITFEATEQIDAQPFRLGAVDDRGGIYHHAWNFLTNSDASPYIKTVSKRTYMADEGAQVVAKPFKAFDLSVEEILGMASSSYPGEGEQYTFYKNGGNKRKTISTSAWWTRSTSTSGKTLNRAMGSLGFTTDEATTNSRSYCSCFCI